MSNAEPALLLAALRESPSNSVLLKLVLQACVANGDGPTLSTALQLHTAAAGSELQRQALDLSPDQLDDAAQLLLRANDLAAARLVAPSASAIGRLLAARLLLEQGDRGAAQLAYREALALNPTLDDAALAGELAGKVVSLAAVRKGAVTSIANDPTGVDDAVRLLQPQAERVDFSNVGGLDAVKQQIRRRIITPFLKPSLFDRFKRRAGGGILLYGPPGCGKTLLARATAGECRARFINVAITDVLDMYIGESERKLHELFELARRSAPAVVFFDEIEALGGKRQHAREATSTKLVSQFLTELDGFGQNNQGVLILGATNVPWSVDPAFRRPGRFDRVLFVPPPDQSARRQILAHELAGRPCEPDLPLDELARRTSGFSGADLRNLVETAVDEAIEASMQDGREVPLTAEHLRAALSQSRATTLEWLTSARNHARYANQGGQYDEVLDFLKQHGEHG